MRLAAVLVGLSAAFASDPAAACITSFAADPSDVRHAELVVVGRVTNYQLVANPEAQERRKKLVAKSPELDPKLRKKLETQRDYARFQIEVEKVLKGRVSEPITVTWDNTTFGESGQISSQSFVIALHKQNSPWEALRGQSATVLSNQERKPWTLLQAPCSSAFIFEMGSRRADAVLNALGIPTQP